jgi:hypothetical protein
MKTTYKYPNAKCGHPSNRSGVECYACARKRYYQKNKDKVKQQNNEWAKRNTDKRNAIAYRYQESVGERPPRELIELRRAVKRLENAVAYTNKCKGISSTSEQDGDYAFE